MKYTVSIKRQKDADSKPYFAVFEYESEGRESAATMLENLNAGLEDPISWQSSCLQKKCGACAMVINGVPRLACSVFLKDLGKKIKLEPLSKFPVIRDLTVDRGFIFNQLKEMKMWLEKGSDTSDARDAQDDPGTGTGNLTNPLTTPAEDRLHFEAASCLMCGCCLEVCPNFSVKLGHMGAVGIVNAYRIKTSEKSQEHRAEVDDLYIEKVFNTCGKSFSCIDICPAGLPIEKLMVKNMNTGRS